MNCVADCRLIELPEIREPGGSLTAVHGGSDVPFQIRRVYYVYDIPADVVRGGHAHRETLEVLVAVLGSFDVDVFDGHDRRRFNLRHANHGLLLPTMIWRDLLHFSAGAVCVVLSSDVYFEPDYIRDPQDFLVARAEL